MEKRWILLTWFIIAIFVINFTPIISSDTYSIQTETLDTFLFLETTAHGKMKERLNLDKNVQLDSQDKLPASMNQYDGLILIDYVPSSSEISQIQTFSQNGGGVLIITGPDLTKNASLLLALNLITNTKGQAIGTITLPRPSDLEHPIISNIEWNSVPSATRHFSYDLCSKFHLWFIRRI